MYISNLESDLEKKEINKRMRNLVQLAFMECLNKGLVEETKKFISHQKYKNLDKG